MFAEESNLVIRDPFRLYTSFNFGERSGDEKETDWELPKVLKNAMRRAKVVERSDANLSVQLCFVSRIGSHCLESRFCPPSK
jgi:hypothetical protein